MSWLEGLSALAAQRWHEFQSEQAGLRAGIGLLIGSCWVIMYFVKPSTLNGWVMPRKAIVLAPHEIY